MALMLPFKYFIKAEDTGKKKVIPSLLIIPSLFDVIATIFDSTGLIYVSLNK